MFYQILEIRFLHTYLNRRQWRNKTWVGFYLRIIAAAREPLVRSQSKQLFFSLPQQKVHSHTPASELSLICSRLYGTLLFKCSWIFHIFHILCLYWELKHDFWYARPQFGDLKFQLTPTSGFCWQRTAVHF